MLEPVIVKPEQLYLDPNNPRLARNFGFDGNVPMDRCEELQSSIEKQFGLPTEKTPQEETDELLSDEDDVFPDDFFAIDELKDSIRNIGFVGIQNIVVCEIPGSNKYIVVEGNRRVASIKSVLREHKQALPGDTNRRIEDENILKSLNEIQVMVFATDGLTDEEIRQNISTMLGLRHYGSRLNWELLPRAKNIYDEFMKGINGSFEYDPKRASVVAETIAKPVSEVRKLIRGYVCYRQLAELYQVRPHHFSLILAAVENSNLTAFGFFEIDAATYLLSGDSADNMQQVCQFSARDKPDFEKIIKDPKQFKKLGTIKKDSSFNSENAVKDYADGLFLEVLEQERSLDDAYTDLSAFKKRLKWVQALSKLLDKQESNESLLPTTFLGAGNELMLHSELVTLVRKFQRIMAD
jgi:hypothetical protein